MDVIGTLDGIAPGLALDTSPQANLRQPDIPTYTTKSRASGLVQFPLI
jgi:hypothetical protein